VVAFTGEVELTAMGKVASLIKVHAHDRVARVEKGVIYCKVGGSTRKRLHVDMDVLATGEFVGKTVSCSALRQRLHKVDVVYPLVEAAIGITPVVGEFEWKVKNGLLVFARHTERRVTLSVDIVEDRTKCLTHGLRCHGLGGDQDQLTSLTLLLKADDVVDVRVYQPYVGAEETTPVLLATF
jgi:hypothetical protein